MVKKQIVIALFVAALQGHAEDLTKAPSEGGFELGLSSGMPTVLAVQLGYWGPGRVGVVARTALGFGSTIDLGIHLPFHSSGIDLPLQNKVEDRLYLVATAGVIGYHQSYGSLTWTIGPSVGVRYWKAFLQLGPCLYFSSGNTQLLVQGQLGFSNLY